MNALTTWLLFFLLPVTCAYVHVMWLSQRHSRKWEAWIKDKRSAVDNTQR